MNPTSHSPIAAFTSTGSDSGENPLSPATFTALTLNTYFSPVIRPWQMNLWTQTLMFGCLNNLYTHKNNNRGCGFTWWHLQACCCTAPTRCCPRCSPRCSNPPTLWHHWTLPKTPRLMCLCFEWGRLCWGLMGYLQNKVYFRYLN